MNRENSIKTYIFNWRYLNIVSSTVIIAIKQPSDVYMPE